MKWALPALVGLTGLLVSGCGPDIENHPECHISNVRVWAGYDENGHLMHHHSFQYARQPDCSRIPRDTSVLATFDNVTNIAVEAIAVPEGYIIAEWSCTSNPWISAAPNCTKISASGSNIVPFGPVQHWDWRAIEQRRTPLSRLPLQAIDVQTNRVGIESQLKWLAEQTPGIGPGQPVPIREPRKPEAFEPFWIGPGSQGPRVEAIQHLLRFRGHMVSVDGDYGTETTNAMRAWQRTAGYGIRESGVLDLLTLFVLGTDAGQPVKMGEQGERIMALQTLLILQGHPVSLDGDFGPETMTAVKAFQTAAPLEVTGEVNTRTWRALMYRQAV